MSTTNLWLPCNACNKSIPVKSNKCPHCSAAQPRAKRKKWLFIGLGVFVGLSFLNVFTNSPNEASLEKSDDTARSIETNAKTAKKAEEIRLLTPDQQRDFVSIVNVFKADFETAKNEIQQSMSRDRRAKEIGDLISSTTISKWFGTIKSIETTSEGKGVLMINVGNNVYVGTWNNALSDYLDGTLIEKSDPVYAALANMKAGDKIIFSGKFIRSHEDGVKERSITIRGSMQEPEFLFKFSNITKP